MPDLLIPRLVIRERRPPEPRVTARIEGWMRWELIDRRGRVRRGGEQHNLILDQGLDLIATYGVINAPQTIGINPTSLIQYAAVGTDSTEPTTSDTALGAEVTRTNIGSNGEDDDESISRSSPGVYQHTRTYEFDFNQANGNLTEWGISPSSSSGSNLYARELFRDGSGDPQTVTKTSDDKLRIVYTREITISPVTMTSASLNITGHTVVNGKYMLIGGNATGSQGYMDLRVFSIIASGAEPTVSQVASYSGGGLWLPTSDLSGIAYTNTLAMGGEKLSTANDISMEVHENAPAYTSGAFTRDGYIIKFPTSKGNFEHFGIGITGRGQGATTPPQLGFIFDYDNGEEWTKDNLHELRVTLPTVTWGRVTS